MTDRKTDRRPRDNRNEHRKNALNTAMEENTRELHKDRAPRKERRPRKEDSQDEDDRGTVQDCQECGFAFFSRWEPGNHDTFERDTYGRPVAPQEWRTCDKCIDTKLFTKNIEVLNNL